MERRKPDGPDENVASLLLIHGAGSGPWVFRDWEGSFPGLAVSAVDLQAGLDVPWASMRDYAEAAVAAARGLPWPVALCGWSMGGLVALQAAGGIRPQAVVLIEASPPIEVQGRNPGVELDQGTFDPEVVYGRFPVGVRARVESSLARAERKRGISVPSLSCPSLVVSGADFAIERGAAIAAHYGSERLEFPELGHWDLVLDPRVRAAVARWLGAGLTGRLALS